ARRPALRPPAGGLAHGPGSGAAAPGGPHGAGGGAPPTRAAPSPGAPVDLRPGLGRRRRPHRRRRADCPARRPRARGRRDGVVVPPSGSVPEPAPRPHLSEEDPVADPYLVTQLDELEPLACPCGHTRRGFVQDDNDVATVHLLDATLDARAHYHKR